MRSAAILLVACAGVTACVTPHDEGRLSLTKTLPNCGFEDIHANSGPLEKLPNGLVGGDGNYGSGTSYGKFYAVEDCRTSDALSLARTGAVYSETGEPIADPDRTAEVAAIRRLLLTGQVTTLAELEQKSRKRRISVTLRGARRTEESCGCALYYPELRGDKKAYASPGK